MGYMRFLIFVEEGKATLMFVFVVKQNIHKLLGNMVISGITEVDLPTNKTALTISNMQPST